MTYVRVGRVVVVESEHALRDDDSALLVLHRLRIVHGVVTDHRQSAVARGGVGVHRTKHLVVQTQTLVQVLIRQVKLALSQVRFAGVQQIRRVFRLTTAHSTAQHSR